MAVRKVKAEKQANYVLPMVEQDLILPWVLTVLGQDYFDGALGDTVNLKVAAKTNIATPAREFDFRGRTGPIVLDDIYETGGKLPVKLTTHIYHATGLEDEHFTLDDINFAQEVLGPQAESVTQQIEKRALAGFRNLSPKATVPFDAGDDPFLAILEARRLMDSWKVAPREGRVVLVGSDVAAAMIASDRLSTVELSDRVTPAVREATIGRLAGTPVVEHSGLDPDEAYYLHSSGLVLGNVAPDVPRGAVTGNTGVGRRGLRARWIQDYDANYLRDRSIVSSFLGVNEIRDERRADGGWMVEDGDGFDADQLAVMKNPDGTDVTPVATGTRKNVRIIPFDVTGTGSVLPPAV